MYIPKHFQAKDKEEIFNVIEENGFATLYSQSNGTPWATHLPLILDRSKKFLYGHFARANPQWKEIEHQTVLAIFQGPHCYISPSWYETYQTVPTWNYIAVHVTGKLEIIEGQELKDSLEQLVLKYEGPTSSYQLSQVDPTYIANLMKGLIGFRIEIKQLEGQFKLSQNHSKHRQSLVIQQLEKSKRENEESIAKFMKRNLANNA